MEERARIRISLDQREIEIEGSESFLRRYEHQIETFLERLREDAPQRPAAPAPASATAGLGSFGEFIQHLPSSSTDVDKMLAAGFHVQENSPDRTFSTAEASRRLVDHGFKIGNPSQCVRQSLQAKRVFVVQRGRYRVSQIGRHHLRQLMGEVIPREPAAGATPGSPA